ncbi:MAG: SCO family protein [Calditrichaeota bacterium]|nr:SCO family protein [Calditrichota bacterium]
MSIRSRIVLTFTFVLFFSCSQKEETYLPYFISADFTPYWAAEHQFNPDTIHRVAPFSFTDQHGQTVNQTDFYGKIYVSDFFYTSCTSVCPTLTRNMKMVQDAFSTDSLVKIISHSVTPWIDSIPTLQLYAKSNEAIDGKWYFVTGEKSDIYRLARQSYFAEEESAYQKADDDFLHTEHFTLVDPSGHIRGVYNGTLELEVQRLIEDIRILELEVINDRM